MAEGMTSGVEAEPKEAAGSYDYILHDAFSGVHMCVARLSQLQAVAIANVTLCASIGAHMSWWFSRCFVLPRSRCFHYLYRVLQSARPAYAPVLRISAPV